MQSGVDDAWRGKVAMSRENIESGLHAPVPKAACPCSTIPGHVEKWTTAPSMNLPDYLRNEQEANSFYIAATLLYTHTVQTVY